MVIALLANGLRRGRRWAWIWTIVLAAFNILTGALLLVLVLAVGAGTVEAQVGDFNVALAQSAMWMLLLVYLIWVRGAFRARRRTTIGIQPVPTVDDVKTALRTHGGGTLSWMTTWEGNSYARTKAGGIVAYQRRAGVALVLADPIGPMPHPGRERWASSSTPPSVPASCRASSARAMRRDRPCPSRGAASSSPTTRSSTCPGCEFTGKRWNAVRTSLNRAGREDMTFRMTRLGDEPWGIRQQLRAISEMWVGDKGLPEMGFTLGTLDEAEDPEVRLALAISPAGDVDGFLSWLPVYGESGGVRGWTLDLMRRREGGFGTGDGVSHRLLRTILLRRRRPDHVAVGGARSPTSTRRMPAPSPRCRTASPRPSSRSTASARFIGSKRSSTRATRRCTCSSATRPTSPASAPP